MPCTLPLGDVPGRFRSPWASIHSVAPAPARLRHPSERAHRDRMVAAEHERHEPLVGRVADEARDPLAGLHDRRQVPGRRVADVGRLRHRRADVAPVRHLVADVADARLELRVADRRRPHVDAAAPGPKVEPGPDDRHAAMCFSRAHGEGIYARCRARRRDRPGRARHTHAVSEGDKWRGPDLNRRHHGFQPCALPTELPRLAGRKCSRTKRDVRTGATASRTSLYPELYASSSLRARSAMPGPAAKSATWANPRRSRPACNRLGGTQIGVRAPML